MLGADGRTQLFAVNGTELWTQIETPMRAPADAAIDAQSRVLTVGGTEPGVEDLGVDWHGWIIQRDAAGEPLWTATLGPGDRHDAYHAVDVRDAGPVAATGRLDLTGPQGAVVTGKFGADGEPQWTALHTGTGDLAAERGLDVALDAQAAVYILARESISDGDQTRLIKYKP